MRALARAWARWRHTVTRRPVSGLFGMDTWAYECRCGERWIPFGDLPMRYEAQHHVAVFGGRWRAGPPRDVAPPVYGCGHADAL